MSLQTKRWTVPKKKRTKMNRVIERFQRKTGLNDQQVIISTNSSKIQIFIPSFPYEHNSYSPEPSRLKQVGINPIRFVSRKVQECS